MYMTVESVDLKRAVWLVTNESSANYTQEIQVLKRLSPKQILWAVVRADLKMYPIPYACGLQKKH